MQAGQHWRAVDLVDIARQRADEFIGGFQQFLCGPLAAKARPSSRSAPANAASEPQPVPCELVQAFCDARRPAPTVLDMPGAGLHVLDIADLPELLLKIRDVTGVYPYRAP